jgi:hypothetical protein
MFGDEMAKIARIGSRCALNSRRTITVELPEFLLQALEVRVSEANVGADHDEDVTLDHVLELELAESLSIGEVALLEEKVPGIGEAVSLWLREID